VLSQHKPFHILIVDNSPDHTADKVRLLQSDLVTFFLENRKRNQVWEQLMFMGLNGH
jgi:dolichol-phosphate mannosyltransferase